MTKRNQPPPPMATPLEVVTAETLQLEEKLRLETRTCGTCRYVINNPMTDRCPRCFSIVPLSEHTNCGECSHQGNCAFQQQMRK